MTSCLVLEQPVLKTNLPLKPQPHWKHQAKKVTHQHATPQEVESKGEVQLLL